MLFVESVRGRITKKCWRFASAMPPNHELMSDRVLGQNALSCIAICGRAAPSEPCPSSPTIIRVSVMLSAEHCLTRAERLRISMLTEFDPAAASRLRGFVYKYRRGFVYKYRILADRAKKEVEPEPPS